MTDRLRILQAYLFNFDEVEIYKLHDISSGKKPDCPDGSDYNWPDKLQTMGEIKKFMAIVYKLFCGIRGEVNIHGTIVVVGSMLHIIFPESFGEHFIPAVLAQAKGLVSASTQIFVHNGGLNISTMVNKEESNGEDN